MNFSKKLYSSFGGSAGVLLFLDKRILSRKNIIVSVWLIGVRANAEGLGSSMFN